MCMIYDDMVRRWGYPDYPTKEECMDCPYHGEECESYERSKTMTREETREEAIEKILEYFSENEEEFNDVIEEMDSYNGFLDEDRWIPMERLDEELEGLSPTRILMKARFGYAYGRHDEPFDTNADYFRFNGYANLVSSWERDYRDHLDEYFAEELIELGGRLALPDEVAEIIENIEEE